MRVHFQFDWVNDGAPLGGASESTMAKLSIKVDGATVTSVLDRQNRQYRDHLIVPLVSVAEWLVSNWWHLWYEVADTSEQRPGFEARHNLAFVGDGFVLPSLTLIPSEGRVHLQWTRRKPQHARIEFVDTGTASVERTALEEEFRNLIGAVLERLRGANNRDTAAEYLSESWAAIESLDPGEREFSHAAALLGLDPFDVRDSVADAITRFWEGSPPSIRHEALASASEDSLSRVSQWLDASIDKLAEVGSETDWARFRVAKELDSGVPPWERGYAVARAVRRQLGIGDGRYDFEATGPLAIHHREAHSPSRRLQGLVAADAPACVTIPKREAGRRFLLARALGDYLDRTMPGAGILSSAATDRQARSRAFAAEFLAPAESLRERFKGDFADDETLDEIGREFGVSSQVIRRQIENHGLAASYADRNRVH